MQDIFGEVFKYIPLTYDSLVTLSLVNKDYNKHVSKILIKEPNKRPYRAFIDLTQKYEVDILKMNAFDAFGTRKTFLSTRILHLINYDRFYNPQFLSIYCEILIIQDIPIHNYFHYDADIKYIYLINTGLYPAYPKNKIIKINERDYQTEHFILKDRKVIYK